MNNTENFAKRLISLREEKGFTQQMLADKIGVTRQSLSLYEKAERTINIDMLVKISDCFDVSADYLLGLSDVKTKDVNIQAVCSEIGLSESAYKGLILMREYEPDDLQAVNFMLGEYSESKTIFNNSGLLGEESILSELSKYLRVVAAKTTNTWHISESGKLINGGTTDFNEIKENHTFYEDILEIKSVDIIRLMDRILLDSVETALKNGKENFQIFLNTKENNAKTNGSNHTQESILDDTTHFKKEGD